MNREGRSIDAFELEKFRKVQATFVGDERAGFPWLYPPTYVPVVAPLAYFSVPVAFWLWGGFGILLYAISLRSITLESHVWLFALAGTGTFVTLLQGQNGFLVASLLVGAMTCLIQRKDRLAGLLIGLLLFKPHFGILLPLVLLAGKRYQAFVFATVTSCGVLLLSTLWCGLEYWHVYFEKSPGHYAALLDMPEMWNRMPTVMASLQTFGLSADLAKIFFVILVVPVLISVYLAWQKMGPCGTTASLLISGTCLIVPYLLFYDLLLLAPAVVFLWSDRSASRTPAVWQIGVVGFVLLLPFGLKFSPWPLAWVGLAGTSMVYAWGIIQAYSSNAAQAQGDGSEAGEVVETANGH